MRYPIKSASGNRLGQNTPAVDDKVFSVALYEVVCASFVTNSRTSPLSRAFSFVKWRPRLSTSRRSLLDSFAPSRSSHLMFFGAFDAKVVEQRFGTGVLSHHKSASLRE